MASNLKTRIAKIEQNPAVIKAAKYQREVEEWEAFVNYYMADLKRYIATCEYEGCTESRETMAEDFLEYELTVIWRLSERHPINVGEFWPYEIAEPVRVEVYRETMLRWYGFKRTDEQEAEAMRLSEQLLSDFDASLPREQSEAAALYEQSYARHPRLNYRYENLPEIKPEGWEW
jgi:hypothetical protein